METLRDLVASSNLYLRDAKPLNALLLYDIAVYITEMLTIFGAIVDKPKIGFPISTGDSRSVSTALLQTYLFLGICCMSLICLV